MSDGRTVWRARDARWFAREWIVILGEDFGSDGPSVISWLEDEAKLQNDGGRVKTGPRSISRGCFVDADTVGHVLSRSVTLGLLLDYEERGDRFTCRISWFAADQGKAMAANRKARQRAATPIDPGDPPSLSRSVPASHAESRPVTECPPTVQDSTEQKNNVNINAELRSAVVECFAYWQERCGHPQALLSEDRAGKIKARLQERRRMHGGDLRLAILDARLAVDGAAVGAYVDDAGRRHDGIGLIFRNNEKLEDFMARASARPAAVVSIRDERRERQLRGLAAMERLANPEGDAA